MRAEVAYSTSNGIMNIQSFTTSARANREQLLSEGVVQALDYASDSSDIIPWDRLLEESVLGGETQIDEIANVKTEDVPLLIFPAEEPSKYVFIDRLPNILKDLYGEVTASHATSMCPHCHTVLVQSALSEQKGSLKESLQAALNAKEAGIMVLVALSTEMLLKRDRLEWQVAADIFGTPRIIEKKYVIRNEQGKGPDFLILDSYTFAAGSDFAEAVEALTQFGKQHGVLDLFLYDRNAPEETALTPLKQWYDDHYCLACRQFFAKATLKEASIQEQWRVLLSITARHKEFASWHTYFSNVRVQELLKDDRDFQRIHNSIIAYFDSTKDIRMPVVFESSKRKWISILPVLQRVLGPNSKAIAPAPIEIFSEGENRTGGPMSELEKRFSHLEIIGADEQRISRLFQFRKFDQKLGLRMAKTLTARRLGITAKQISNIFVSVYQEIPSEILSLEYLEMKLDDLFSKPIAVVHEKLRDDGELHDILSMLIGTGLGEVPLAKSVSSLLGPEQERCLILHRMLINDRLRGPRGYVVESCFEDLGPQGADNFLRILEGAKSSRDSVFYKTSDGIFSL